jgi:hypothetical protein
MTHRLRARLDRLAPPDAGPQWVHVIRTPEDDTTPLELHTCPTCGATATKRPANTLVCIPCAQRRSLDRSPAP